MVEISEAVEAAVKWFEPLEDIRLFENEPSPTHMKIFMPKLNGRKFDYETMQDVLFESITGYVLSRKSARKYLESKHYQHMTKVTRKAFKEVSDNKGELGELILYVLLEGHLKAPKILSKMSLKTSPNDYVKGCDGVHFRKLENGRYHLIFGESKLYEDLTSGFRKAFESIEAFRNDHVVFEKQLISRHIDDEEFDESDLTVIKQLLYPHCSDTIEVNIKCSDAYGIFIGFEISVDEDKKSLSEDQFESWIKSFVLGEIRKRVNTIQKQIEKAKLKGESFYVYLMPFTELNATREKLMEDLTS